MPTPAQDALARILADSPISVADVREFIHDHPSLLQAITASLPPVADDVPDDMIAATLVHATTGQVLPPLHLGGLAIAPPAPKTRYRERLKEDAAWRASIILYSDGIPGPAVLPRKELYARIREYLLRHKLIATTKKGTACISNDTIRIALGLKKRRSR
jgi:hypothetical protein